MKQRLKIKKRNHKKKEIKQKCSFIKIFDFEKFIIEFEKLENDTESRKLALKKKYDKIRKDLGYWDLDDWIFSPYFHSF